MCRHHCNRYLGVTVMLHLLWGLAGMLWLAVEMMCNAAYQEDDLDRAIALRELAFLQVQSHRACFAVLPSLPIAIAGALPCLATEWFLPRSISLCWRISLQSSQSTGGWMPCSE